MKLVILFLSIFLAEQAMSEPCCNLPKPVVRTVYKTNKVESKPCCEKQQLNSTSESKAGRILPCFQRSI